MMKLMINTFCISFKNDRNERNNLKFLLLAFISFNTKIVAAFLN